MSHIKYSILPVMVLIFATPHMAFAQSSDSLSGLYACEDVVGDTAQLACFRAETAKIRVSGAVTAAKKPAFNKNFEKKSEAPRSQTLAITKAETLKVSGYTRFTLENGEVWQQTESSRMRLGRGSPDVLVINKGKIGGYLAKVNDKRPSFRVKRVK